jgi:molecular chaperone GrpE (heat shock protein)
MPLALLLERSIFKLGRMSDDRGPARLAKWPFYLADVLLCAIIFVVLHRLGTFEGTGETVIVAVCLLAGAIAAWLSVLPWLKEHDAAVHLGESKNLKSSLEQIQTVEKVADLIRQSNAQWQGVQEASARTVNSAREITDRMKAEAEEFMKFISNAHDQERAGLRLEVEKLRRMEGDWIKTSVQILDHVFALTRAAERSGQAQLIRQLHQFQNACRDVARRMGLATFVPAAGEPFDQRAHQLTTPQATAREDDRVQDVLACGFTYQGQLLRRSLVVLESSQPSAASVAAGEEEKIPEAQDSLTQENREEGVPNEDQNAGEPPAIIDSSSEEAPSGERLEAGSVPSSPGMGAGEETFEEIPAIVDTFSEEGGLEEPSRSTEPEDTRSETPGGRQEVEGAEERPAAAGKREKRRNQEELPF